MEVKLDDKETFFTLFQCNGGVFSQQFSTNRILSIFSFMSIATTCLSETLFDMTIVPLTVY